MGAYYSHLSDCERVRIMMLRSCGYGVRAISRDLSRSPYKISDELKRNGHKESYSAGLAEVKSKLRRHKKQRTLHNNLRLKNYIFAKIRKGWSPQAVSGKLLKIFGRRSINYVSHEIIYASIYAITRGNLRTSLIKALRQSHKTRRPRARGKDRRGQIPDLRSIHECPQEVQDRLIPGHWEGDLIKGKGNASAIGTLGERTSRYLILVQLDDATSPVVTGGFT